MATVDGMLTYLGVADTVDDRGHSELEDSQDQAAGLRFSQFEEAEI